MPLPARKGQIAQGAAEGFGIRGILHRAGDRQLTVENTDPAVLQASRKTDRRACSIGKPLRRARGQLLPILHRHRAERLRRRSAMARTNLI